MVKIYTRQDAPSCPSAEDGQHDWSRAAIGYTAASITTVTRVLRCDHCQVAIRAEAA